MQTLSVMGRATLLWILLSSISLSTQIAPVPPGAKAPPDPRPGLLHWDRRRSQELSRKQSIGRTENLSRTERDRLIAAIADQLSDYDFQTDEERKKAPEDARVKYVGLGKKGDSEVIVQAGDSTLCSPTGNCAFWILRRQGKSYVPLLKAEAQTFTLQQTRNRGFLGYRADCR